MGKFLLLIIFAVVVYLLLARGRRQRNSRATAHEAEAMARCAHCGVHVPMSESVIAGERRYCCEEHRRLAER